MRHACRVIGARFAHGQITLEEAARAGCSACASPGGGCQFLGTAATSQVVGEALGMSLTHSALAPSGHAIWLDMARRSARAALELEARGIPMRDIVTEAALRNAMVTHAAFGGSTNLILHLTAIAHAAGLGRPTAADWADINRRVPRLVDALPNGPRNFATVQVFLAGGVPEVMLHLRRAGLLDMRALTASGETLGRMLDWWEGSERRARLRQSLQDRDGIDPADVIMDPDSAARRGLDFHRLLPRRQPGAGRRGDQEHRHRPLRARCRWRLPQARPGARLYLRTRRHRRHQERRREGWRYRRPHLPRPHGRRAWRKLTN